MRPYATASPKREAFLRKWLPTDITYGSFIGAMHLAGEGGPYTSPLSQLNLKRLMSLKPHQTHTQLIPNSSLTNTHVGLT